MGTKRLGNEYRLWIEGAVPGTYAEVKGQRSLGITATAGLIDISDKNNSPYNLSAPGNFDGGITMDLLPDLPDVNGAELMFTTFKTRAIKKFQIRKGGSTGATPGDVEFEGKCYVLSWGRDMNRNEARAIKTNLGYAEAPTIDILL